MELLSKYVPTDQFLDNGLFRFTQPASLNDPDEARPTVLFNGYAPEDLEAAAVITSRNGFKKPPDTEYLKDIYLAPYPSGRFDENSFPGLWPANEPRLRETPFASHAEFDRAVAERAVELCLKHANRSLLIFSLTSATASDHMWANYANNHQGVEVRFRRNHPFFADRLHKIIYSDEPVRVSSNDGWVRLYGKTVSTEDILDGKLQDFPIELVLRKRCGWQREHEVRLLCHPDEATVVLGQDSIGNDVYLFEVPPAAIETIVLGYRASNDFVQTVLNKVQTNSRWSEVNVSRLVNTPAGVHEERIHPRPAVV